MPLKYCILLSPTARMKNLFGGHGEDFLGNTSDRCGKLA